MSMGSRLPHSWCFFPVLSIYLKKFWFCLKLDNILLCICSTFSFSIYLLMDICFQFLAIMKRVKMNMIEYLQSDEESFGYIHKSGKAGSWYRSTPASWGSSTLICTMPVQVCTLARNEWVFSTSLSAWAVICFVDLGNCEWCNSEWWNLRVVLVCISLNPKDLEHFLAVSWPFMNHFLSWTPSLEFDTQF